MINVIEAIEEKLQAQKDEILFKNFQIEDLKKQIDELKDALDIAEAEREKAVYELKRIRDNNREGENND